MNVLRFLKKAILYLYTLCLAKVNHIGYLRYIGVNLGNNVNVYGNPFGMFGTEPWIITVGNNVHITREVFFITHYGGTLLFRDQIPDLKITAPIVICDNVYIGVRSTILPEVMIGANSIIAAKSVISKDEQANSVYAGIPAKRIKSIDEYLSGIRGRSLHLSHLKKVERDKALRKIFRYKQDQL